AASYGSLYGAGDSAARVLSFGDVFAAIDSNHDATLSISEAQSFMSTDWLTRPASYDSDGDGFIDNGLAVNTGDPANPVILTFEDLLVEIEIAGTITINAGSISLAQLAGIFYLETDASEFKLFATATVKLGPDISAASPSVTLDASAVIVINSSGVAADLRSSTNLSGIGITYNSSAGIRVNTTEQDQTVVLPQRIVDFVNHSNSPLRDELLLRLHTEQLDVFDTNADGVIKVSELEALSGKTSFSPLYTTTPSRQTAIDVRNLVTALDSNKNGVLEVSEAAAFLAAENAHLATDADRFASGILTDALYFLISRAIDANSSEGSPYAVVEAHGDI
ncbi:MAG: hypothetical protein ACK5MO_02585, partial [Planctomyces sp.]